MPTLQTDTSLLDRSDIAIAEVVEDQGAVLTPALSSDIGIDAGHAFELYFSQLFYSTYDAGLNEVVASDEEMAGESLGMKFDLYCIDPH